MSVSVTPKTRTPVERVIVSGHRIACDGGGGALGHPKVWYEMGSDHEVECLYCGLVFVQDDTQGGGGH
jgi:uncharacterized Zn-finger protein